MEIQWQEQECNAGEKDIILELYIRLIWEEKLAIRK